MRLLSGAAPFVRKGADFFARRRFRLAVVVGARFRHCHSERSGAPIFLIPLSGMRAAQ